MELIKLLPDYYSKNETMKLLQGILSEQTDELEITMQKTVDGCFVESASNTLSRYEMILGIITDLTKSDRFRRERIKSKLSGSGTTTSALIQKIAESYTNADVELTEQNADYSVKVKFVGTSGIPGNIDDIKKSIKEAIPAHLKIIYEYIFNTYGSTGTFTHEELSAYTHEKIRGGHNKNRLQELQVYHYGELKQLKHEEISKGDLPNGN